MYVVDMYRYIDMYLVNMHRYIGMYLETRKISHTQAWAIFCLT